MEVRAVSNCFAPIAQPLQGWVTGVGAVQGQSDAPKKGECPLYLHCFIKKKKKCKGQRVGVGKWYLQDLLLLNACVSRIAVLCTSWMLTQLESMA